MWLHIFACRLSCSAFPVDCFVKRLGFGPPVEKTVTLPTPDAQSSRFLSQHTQPTAAIPATPSTHSMPFAPLSSTPPMPSESVTEPSEMYARRRATEFAGHSWDLATGGLKTLTAKRELPPRLGRRVDEPTALAAAQRSYTFALVILACVVVMLISGGIVLFVLLQP